MQNDIHSIIATRLDSTIHKTYGDIAFEAGFDSRNVMSIIKKGEMKVPLERIEGIAKALEMPVRDLVEPALRQYFSEDVIEMLRTHLCARKPD